MFAAGFAGNSRRAYTDRLVARKKSRLRAGDVFAQKYVILSVLGEGGMGVVYEAEHTMLAQRVAIKMLKDSARESDEFVKRFGREARASAKLRGVNVARVYDVDILDDGTPYMVMEYLEGHDLGAELDARGQLPISEAVGYVLEAASAMAEAHELGVVHRDLKPSNLYFAEQKDGSRVLKVLDFGISKTLFEQEVSVTMTQSSLGTPMYMSPEQIRSAKNVDRRTDIWSLGVILYEMLTGDVPFDGESPSAIIASVTADPIVPPREKRADIPEELDAIVMKALSKNADGRFDSIEQLAEALLDFAPSPDLWAPASVRSNPRASFPSFPGEGNLNPTLDAAQISSDIAASGSVDIRGIETGHPAVTADPAVTMPSAKRTSRGATQQNWTADSADQKLHRPRRKAIVGAVALVAVAAAGFGVFSLVRGRGAPEDVAPARVSEEVRGPRNEVPPTEPDTPPEVAPTVGASDDAGAQDDSAPPVASAKKPGPKVSPGWLGFDKSEKPPKEAPPAAPKPAPAPKKKPATPEGRHPLTL